MKKIFSSLALVLAFLLVGCFAQRDYIIDYDYSYLGKFKSYKTFGFMNNGENEIDSAEMNPIIAEAIKYRLEIQGYKYTDKKPNLLVSYKIFYKDLRYRGYNQPDIENWVKRDNEEEEYNPIKYNLREGTLLITMFDRQQRHTVWQGYASGLFGSTNDNNKRYVKRAVRSIFDRYRFLAEGFEAKVEPEKD